jgi:NarL family two-component system sensor histidine kinase LiaS
MVEADPVKFGNMTVYIEWYNPLHVYYISTDDIFIDSLPHDTGLSLKPNQPFDPTLITGLEAPWAAAHAGIQDQSQLFTRLEDGSVVGAMPIKNKDNPDQLLGTLVFATKSRFGDLWPIADVFQDLGISLLFITLFAGMMGIIFGGITARGLVNRLKEVSTSAHSWSQGNFTVFVDDPAGDELSQLADDLNKMARQLEDLIDEREELSALEERNRLARDLHDSVKQQAFAAAAQLAAANAKLDTDPQKAKIHLREAETLAYSIRQELTDLINELHPVALKGQGLVPELRGYLSDWSQQNGMQTDLRVQGERPLPIDIEQTLFRIIQGALSNIARHSGAQHAELRLLYSSDTVTLTITDDGRGFDPKNQRYGLGLRSIQERTEILNGSVEVNSALGIGTRITVVCNG